MTEDAFGEWDGLAPLDPPERDAWVAAFATALYGPVPPPPAALGIARMPCGPAERISLHIQTETGRGEFDLLLWLPGDRAGAVPLIAALDFVGPFGLPDLPFPPDPRAIICAPRDLGGEAQNLGPTLRGVTGHRWPIADLHEAGFGLLLGCYGSFVPDDPLAWTEAGLKPLLGQGAGAITLWAWALHRLLDVAEALPEAGPVVLAGHSRLGKAALWAGATDPRVAGVFANASGCAGAAPAAHRVGETLPQLTDRYPHWLRDGAAVPDGLDQHHLLAAIAPRPLVLTGARDDIWADPVGSYLALCAASGSRDWPEAAEMWSRGGTIRRGTMCHGLRDGGHDLTAADWAVALPFLREAIS